MWLSLKSSLFASHFLWPAFAIFQGCAEKFLAGPYKNYF